MAWARPGRIGVAAAAVLVLVAIPLWSSGYWVRIATNVWMYVALTAAQNIIAGYAGYPALGNVVFFGLGAYASAVAMTSAGLPIPVALVVGGVVPAETKLLYPMPTWDTEASSPPELLYPMPTWDERGRK